jgi:hypothetical protein
MSTRVQGATHFHGHEDAAEGYWNNARAAAVSYQFPFGVDTAASALLTC